MLRFVSAAALVAGITLALPARSPAQSLRGSRASINRMYRHAKKAKLDFYRTANGVKRARKRGDLVRLVPNADFTLRDVSFPYVTPETRTFVRRLGAQYHDACGARLVVTSAVRPETRQPANSTARSVHPTGMAVDLHKPTSRTCRNWLRETLLSLEGSGVLEVTEEFHPPHFHVAVYPLAYSRWVAARTGKEPSVQQAGRPAKGR